METLERNTETQDFNPEQRLYDDTTTWLAEVLPGMMRTPFEYRFDGRELYARDNSALKPIFDEAVETARRFGPSRAFELRRRLIEIEEYNLMISMARGDAPNTMVVVSDFPPELINASNDIGGYNVGRQQTMLRVITRRADGTLLMRSQSLDMSDRTALEEIYLSLGFKTRPGELLGQRMLIDLQTEEQEFLTDQLMGVYDRSLSTQYGGQYYAGRKNEQPVNTYDFVRAQTDLVGAFVTKTKYELDEQQLYNLAAAMRDRFEISQDKMSDSQLAGIFSGDTGQEMAIAGQNAASKGDVFNGCGVSLGARGQTSSGAMNELGQLGFGNKSEQTAKLPPKIRCINCKEKVPTKKVVKPRSWCCPSCKYEVDICSGAVICAGKKRKR